MTNVALFFGGQNTEHEISCLTAAAVAAAIDESFVIHPVGIDKAGHWHRMSVQYVVQMQTRDGVLPRVESVDAPAILFRDENGVKLATCRDDSLDDIVTIDVALSLLHGSFGEDGTIQGLFEMLGLAYVGSGIAASAVGMDKHLMKIVLEQAGIPIGPYEAVTATQWAQAPGEVAARVNRLVYPLFVKPARGGSSVGIVRVTEPTDLDAAINEALAYDPKLVIEQGIVGAREVECAVLEPETPDGAPRVSVPGEIVVHTPDAFYDYEAKYLPDGQVELLAPTSLDDDQLGEVHDLARASFTALGCEGLARVDTFIAPDGTVLVNEVNTMPGFTQLSMFPALWEATGMGYTELITELIRMALSRPRTVIR